VAATVTAELWNSQNSTRLATLPNATGHRWQEVLDDCGSWSLELPVGDSALASAIYGTVVRFLVDDDPAFAGLVEQRELRIVAQGEEVDEVVVLSGRGLLALWEQAVVYPKGGVDKRPSSDVRPFNWCFPENPFFLQWPFVYIRHSKIATRINFDPPLYEPWFPPKGWPAPDTSAWMWTKNYGNRTPSGKCYFIYVYNAPSDMDLVIYLAADNRATLFVDGIVCMETEQYPAFNFEECYRTVVPITAGRHAIGVEAEVYSQTSNGLYRGMVAVSGHRLPTDGSALSTATSVFKSDSTWQALDYPTTIPGYTAGGVVYELLLEALARGALTGWTLSFDNITDSAGEPWPWMLEEVFQMGQDYLSVLRQLGEAYMDVTVDPVGLKLNAYIRNGSGTSAATYVAGSNLTELTHTEKG
jgi:hypothetical protein